MAVADGGVAPGLLTVQVDQPGVKISPLLYGMMPEEINHAYDDGLYGELIQNRSFAFDTVSSVGWSLVRDGDSIGSMVLDSSLPINRVLRTSMKLTIAGVSRGRIGAANSGYGGVPVPRPVCQARFISARSQSRCKNLSRK
jgi:alpha-N-arabinofuranosidase